MATFVFLLVASALALLASSSTASASVVEHSFHVKSMRVRKLCKEQVITAVNGRVPGPTISVREGDTLVVHVFNHSPYNITIHWHGVFQLQSAWADGPVYVTQCPIRPGHSYTYKFNVTGQEGTLWWHAHVSLLRATVYGALIIRPRPGHSYPFPKPHKDIPILLGEWWNANVVDVEKEALLTGRIPNNSDAYTINGKLGDLYQCSKDETYMLKVLEGKNYMLRIVNTAINNHFFFKIANHEMKVVAIDASYTEPYLTDVVVIAPGQTVDVFFTANQTVGSYYIAAVPYNSLNLALPFDNTTTRGVIVYAGSTSSTPLMPVLPDFSDTKTAHKFYTSLIGMTSAPHWKPVPLNVDKHMLVTLGMNLQRCEANATCQGLFGQRFSASMNNESFQFPKTTSVLEAFYYNASEIYTTDFPDEPSVKFDYTNLNHSLDQSLMFAPKSTKVKKLKFNSTVEIVFQNVAFLSMESHPIHLHGFNFHVLAQGFGNYDVVHGPKTFNLVNPQVRNTIGVPSGGWAVIRFQANNPGVWLMHCHVDVHLPWGLATAFVVENGPTPSLRLPPPPSDMPKC